MDIRSFIENSGNYDAIIGKSSITIKSPEGKTAGVITQAVNVSNLQANKAMDFWKQIKGFSGDRKDIFVIDGALYCFRAVNDNTLSCWAAFPEDKTKHDNIIASCIANNITPVIVKHINRKTA